MAALNVDGHAHRGLGDKPASTANNPTMTESNTTAMIDLPTRIHAASRAIHDTLHHAVVGRLTLALPPKATSPHFYALGISRFAQIYFALEDAWHDYLDATADAGDIAHTKGHQQQQQQQQQTRYRPLLAQAYVPAIFRTQRLGADLRNLEAEWGAWVTDSIAQGNDHEKNDVAVREAVTHMLETIRIKPYALLAYSWIMYLALFNGGRWIRQKLVDGGPQFWHKNPSTVEKVGSAVEQSFLSFWYFDGDEDGEDIKLAYRAGFIEASKQLTEEECDDVVSEAKALFQHCLQIITEIDLVVALEKKGDRGGKQPLESYKYLILGVLTLGALLAMIASVYRR